MIPKAEHPDSMPGEEFFANTIVQLTRSIIMAPAIQLDLQLRSERIKIEDVRINRLLPPEFVTAEITIAELSPQNPL
jgi:hypothetical protein